jgi:hypothetical protein
MTESMSTQVTCSNCGKTYGGAQFLWEVLLAKEGKGLEHVAGYQCENCKADFCSTCAESSLKKSWWSGWQKTTCPKCGSKFGPGLVQVDESDPALIESLKKDQEDFRVGKTKLIKSDFSTLLYGVIFAALGYWLLTLGDNILSFVLMFLGGVGIVVGIATLVSRSPVVKLLEALDTLALAVALFVMGITGYSLDVFDIEIPFYIILAACAFFLWSAYDSFKEYIHLKNMVQKARSMSNPK